MKRVLVLALTMLLVVTTGVLVFGEDPDKLIFVNVPGSTTLADMHQFVPILDHVSECIGIPIEYLVVTDYAAVLLAMQYGHADIARVDPFSVIQVKGLFEAEILVREIKANTGTPFYYSVIVVRADSGIETVCDLCRWAHELRLGYVDPLSTSGGMVPKTMLIKLGLVDGDFKEVFYAGGHDSIAIALSNNTIDLCCTNQFRLTKALDAGILREEDVRILLWSDPIPTAPVIVRADLSEDLKERLLEAWLSVPPEATEAFKLAGFAPACWEDYEPIEEIAKALGF